MKKNIYLIVLVAIISALITASISIVCYLMINQSKEKTTFDIITSNNNPITVKETKYTPQGFAVRATGLVNTIVSNITIKDLKVYEFTTGLNDHVKDNEYTYKGVRLSDVIKTIKINDYAKVTLKSTSGKEAQYKKDEIDDSLFIVFEIDGIPYSQSEPLSFLDLNICDCYNIDGLDAIKFE